MRSILHRALYNRIQIKHHITWPGPSDDDADQQFKLSQYYEKMHVLVDASNLASLSGLTREELLEIEGCGQRKCDLAISALVSAGCSLYCPQPIRRVTIEEIEAMSQFC